MSKAKYISKLVDASGSTTSANVSYTGTLTGSTGILNIGSGQLYKDASGNVGIGVTDFSSTGANAKFAISLGGINLDNATVLSWGGGSARPYITASKSSAYLAMGVSGTERMRIDSSGNVGIGTSSTYLSSKFTSLNTTNTPAGVFIRPITITNAISVENSYIYMRGQDNGYGLAIGNYSSTQWIQGMVNDAPSLDIALNPSGGNVGIGTSSPNGKLQVYGGRSHFYANNEPYAIGVGFVNGASSSFAGYIGCANTDIMTFSSSGGAERMRIDSSGNVGIGTSSPSAKLTVRNSTDQNFSITAGTTYGGADGISIFSANDANNAYKDIAVACKNLILNASGGTGNVGIGTSSPPAKFVVAGDSFVNYTGSAGLLFRNLSGINRIDSYNYPITANYPLGILGSYITLSTSDAERLRIDASGNVGIGTSSPSQKLHVAGTIFAAAGVSLGAAVSEGGEIGFQSASGTNAGMIDVDGSNNWRFYNALATPTIFFTNSSERMRIDSSGNVGIGTSSPVCKLNVYSSTAQNDNYGFVQIENPTAAAGVNASYTAKNYSGTSQFMQWENYGLRIGSRIVTNTGLGNIIFTTGNDAERMRIDANGYLLKNTSAFISTSYGNGDFSLVTMSAGLVIKNPGASGAAVPTSIVFLNGAGTAVGYIAVGASVTNFTNLSDYRLKKDVTQINNALDKVSRINPVSFIWKESGEVGESFIAHELQEECPIAVVGNKDDVNEDGSIRPQGVDASKLIPLLTAAIKELKAIIDTQQEQINSLLGK